MSGTTLFSVSEVVVVVLAVGTILFGARLARRHPAAGWATVAGALVWLVAEGVHWLQADAIMPRLAGEGHGGLRVIVSMLGEAVYFGIGGIGILLLFFATVVDRAPRADGRPEPAVMARQVLTQAWRYYNSRNQGRRNGR
ncbi:hypothetical protein ACIP5Y_01700 [Nocardia sp. NPDC088792]|uniref:hypothetical protein n=1 Tax=Nocardia sp. NPDC088792 TaxID=3364332 RepID=UPI00380A8FA7